MLFFFNPHWHLKVVAFAFDLLVTCATLIYLHFSGNNFPLTEYFPEVHRAQHVPECGGSQQPSRAAVVVNVCHRVDWVLHFVIHDGVDKHCNTVLCQDLGGKFAYYVVRL